MAKNIRKNREKISESKGVKHRMQKKQNKPFYASIPRKKRNEKRNPEKELSWIYKQGQGNFGFVDRVDEKTGEKQGYFVHESKKLDAFEGDEVAFEIQYFKGRPEAIIKKVLKRSEHLIVGKLKIGKQFAFVISENAKVKNDIFIPGKHIGGYPDGARVAVQILKWEGKNPEGRIIESLESLPKWREDIYKIAFEMGARKSFSDRIQVDLKKFSEHISSKDLSYRRDMRNILTYTIDGAESKDLDDAISIEKTENGYILYVHIADVAHYVRENSSLDREARKRGTSIYLVDQVIPMLPQKLSNGLCSLHPGEDKLTLTCEMEIGSEGKIVHSSVYESVIQSDFRLTYREIDKILTPILNPFPSEEKGAAASSLLSGENWERCYIWDSLQFGWILTQELLENITLLKEFTDILQKKSQQRGNLDFDFPETKIILDDAWVPQEYKKYERYNSYKIIEECMVLANQSIAKQFSKVPFLYRVHEDPDEEDVEKFGEIIDSVIAPPPTDVGIPLIEGKQKIPPFAWGSLKSKHFQQILEYLKSSPRLEKFQKLLLRTLSKARYSEKDFWHFGLALEYYSHFTSPIRRYADLQIHRIIKEAIRKKYTSERKNHYKDILPKVALRCSETSERAEKMEYRVRDMLACKFMQDKIGEVFGGKISWMIEKWFFVELENTIEGFIEFGFTGYEFNAESFTLMQIATWKELHFWDEVQVRLVEVDMERYRIEFELV